MPTTEHSSEDSFEDVPLCHNVILLNVLLILGLTVVISELYKICDCTNLLEAKEILGKIFDADSK